MTIQPDPPHYTTARDNRRVHICHMAGHSRYWLNVSVEPGLWICERCHPPVGDCALAERWEIVPRGDCEALIAAEEAAKDVIRQPK